MCVGALLVLAKIGISNPMILGAVGVVILFMLYGHVNRQRQNRRREAEFAAMGLRNVASARVFGPDTRKIAHVIRDRADSSISSWAGVAPGTPQAVLFEFAGESTDAQAKRWIVIGFRLPAGVADFEIAHKLLLDRVQDLLPRVEPPPAPKPVAQSAASTGSPERKYGPFKVRERATDRPQKFRVAVEGNADFTAKYIAWAADPAAMPRIVTSRLMEKLVSMDDGNLHLLSGQGWLFIYHWSNSAAKPDRYPALLTEARELFSMIGLPETPVAS